MENNDEENIVKEAPTIKHMVISGGGPTGLSYYGILKETNNMGLWKIENIKSIYGTSVGSMIAVILCLNYDWETIDNYLIKRPWNSVYKFNMYSLIDSYHKRGIFNIKVMEETFSPLFKGKDISLEITMNEFYELTKIELHIFSTELISYELIDFSYKTHPDWKLLDVVYCSSCLPILFSPYLKDEKCYCDGGLITNYPLEICINNGIDPNEILGICKTNKKLSNTSVDENASLLDYLMIILNKFSKNLFVKDKSINIPNEFVVESAATSIYNMYSFANNIEERINLINNGVEIVKVNL
jgi:predicted acylesterase/phospholipase RssA